MSPLPYSYCSPLPPLAGNQLHCFLVYLSLSVVKTNIYVCVSYFPFIYKRQHSIFALLHLLSSLKKSTGNHFMFTEIFLTLFFLLHNTPFYECTIASNFPMLGHLGNFQYFAVVNSAVMNNLAHRYFHIVSGVYWG